jgi:hypothetical protein
MQIASNSQKNKIIYLNRFMFEERFQLDISEHMKRYVEKKEKKIVHPFMLPSCYIPVISIATNTDKKQAWSRETSENLCES